MMPNMANNAIPNGVDGDGPDQLVQRPGSPTAILLFPFDAPPPPSWRVPWVNAGWSVTSCGSTEEIAEALAKHAAKALVASPWPGTGDASSASAIASELQEVVTALHMSDTNAPIGLIVNGGMVRRGDFLAHLLILNRTPESSGCCVLLAAHIDKAEELIARLDGTATFDLEERIAERFAKVLRKDDAFTIWLEFGFGILVNRDTSDEVEKLAKSICAIVASELFIVAGEPIQLTVSIGAALSPRGNPADGADRWFAAAHAAQAIAFRHGGNRHDGLLTRDYEPIPAERVLLIREWVGEAKAGGNVLIEFQPVLPLNAAVADLYSVHAKLRDHRAPLGGVYRREYLRLAREAGAMVMIDRMCIFGAFEALEQERARGKQTQFLVPLELANMEGVPWRWLEAELRRRRRFADGVILELEGNPKLEEPDNVARMLKLRELGVRIGLSDRSGGLERVSTWSKLPVDVLRLQVAVVDALPAEAFRESLAPWREQGRQLIVDSVEKASDMARFAGLGVDYMRGEGLAAIGPRPDYDFG
jgi:EAL domain-containing protein (putative c-di-GMP-specific phosphodiesterase class I)/GGDEF domain-containing protein